MEPKAAALNHLGDYSFQLGKQILQSRTGEKLKELGQFLTPVPVAQFMSRKLGQIRNGGRVLEPAIGSGVLICALIDNLIAEGQRVELWVDGYEIDHDLCLASQMSLKHAEDYAKKKGVYLHWQIHEGDFILHRTPSNQTHLFPDFGVNDIPYDYILANPPYFKLNSADPRVKHTRDNLNGQTNIYTLFMGIAAKLLSIQGRACFIVPRSFCSGSYFSKFRYDFIKEARILGFHLFESRNDVFQEDLVLQENVIVIFEKRASKHLPDEYPDFVEISASKGISNLEDTLISRRISTRQLIDDKSNLTLIRLPTGLLDEKILQAMDGWDGSLGKYGLEVSTGPVVAFRSTELLVSSFLPNQTNLAPLLWMQHIQPNEIEWPIKNFRKPQAISSAPEASALLIANKNYVLLRRFSAKEDRRRLIAAPLLADRFNYAYIGLENHLNYIYKKRGSMNAQEVIGLSALLNNALIDRYIRITNGNTQINAAEIRNLPLPPLEIILEIGKKICDHSVNHLLDLDQIVFSTLQEYNMLPDDFPQIQETRISMGKIEQTQQILETLGLPLAQQDEPGLATNSPRTHYALSQSAIDTLKQFGTEEWTQAVQAFLDQQGALVEIYQQARDFLKIPLKLADGETFHLSPGRHNQLQAAIIQDFAPRFAPGAKLFYIGDTANKVALLDKAGFEKLGLPAPKHGKLPDVVLYDETRNWLLLIEAVTHHGPVSPKRRMELERIFKVSATPRIYVSAFPNTQTFKTYLTEIAWETEVWISDTPDHLIHFNGEKFLKPQIVE